MILRDDRILNREKSLVFNNSYTSCNCKVITEITIIKGYIALLMNEKYTTVESVIIDKLRIVKVPFHFLIVSEEDTTSRD